MAITKGNNSTLLPRKVPNKSQVASGYRTAAKGERITDTNELYTNTSIQTTRFLEGNERIRAHARSNGTLGSAVFSYVQMAHTGHKIMAYDTATGNFSPEGTLLAHQLKARFDTTYDYTEGFSDRMSVERVVTSLLRETALTSAACLELVLDKGRFPSKLSVVAFDSLYWKSSGEGGRFPTQRGTVRQDGQDKDLDIANFWISELERDANSAYPNRMFDAALDSLTHYQEFIEDMRRSVRRSGHNRLTVLLDSEKVANSAPENVRDDSDALESYMEITRSGVETLLSDLNPEDALVTYDWATFNAVEMDGTKTDYTQLLQELSGITATSMRSHPSILGMRIAGSQSLSNTESLVFVRNAQALHRPVNEVMSRAFTLACRLYGSDVYVEFKLNPINLRPEEELEAFKSMRQDNILEQLSLGFISDEEASLLLGTGFRPAGAPKLSGTMFHEKSIDTSNASPNSDPMGRSLQSDQPTSSGGKDNG